MLRHKRAIKAKLIQYQIGIGVLLIREMPTRNDRCIEDKWHDLSAPFVAPSKNLFDRHRLVAPANRFDVSNGLVDFALSLAVVRHEASDGLAVARDHDGFAPLDVIQQVEQVRL